MTGTVSAESLRVAAQILEDVAGAEDELARLDSFAGDGDLGVTVRTAIEALTALLPDLADLEVGEALRRCGLTLARSVPSTSGTLIASAFLDAARVPQAAEAAGTDDAVDPARLIAWLDAGRAAIERRGRAEVGQKTMLDALAPAIEALRAADAAPPNTTPSLADALNAAAEAAEQGAEATRDMEPTVGRAGWLPERSRGNVDAGARLIAIVFRALAVRAG